MPRGHRSLTYGSQKSWWHKGGRENAYLASTALSLTARGGVQVWAVDERHLLQAVIHRAAKELHFTPKCGSSIFFGSPYRRESATWLEN